MGQFESFTARQTALQYATERCLGLCADDVIKEAQKFLDFLSPPAPAPDSP